MKSNLLLRPMWHQKPDRIEAHVFVCVLAYTLWKALPHLLVGAGGKTRIRKKDPDDPESAPKDRPMSPAIALRVQDRFGGASFRPGGALGCSHGWSPAQPNATRGVREEERTRPGRGGGIALDRNSSAPAGAGAVGRSFPRVALCSPDGERRSTRGYNPRSLRDRFHPPFLSRTLALKLLHDVRIGDTLPETVAGRTLRLRRVARPNPEQAKIVAALGLSLPERIRADRDVAPKEFTSKSPPPTVGANE